MDTKKIGAFLKHCRKENNLTQEQLAEKFGVSARVLIFSGWNYNRGIYCSQGIIIF